MNNRARARPQVESLESLCLLAPVTLGPFSATFDEQLIENLPRQVTLPQFDPTLGDLLEVRITASDAIFGRFAIENLSNTDQEATVAAISGQNTLSGPGLEGIAPSNLAASQLLPPLAEQQEDFPSGELFCGPDSVRVGVTPPPSFLPPEVLAQLQPCDEDHQPIIIDAPLSDSVTFSTVLTDPSALAAFLGSGTLSYEFNSTGMAEITGSTGNLATLTLLSSTAEIQIEYVYEPSDETVCVEANASIQGIHHQPSQIVMTFSEPIDASAAVDPENYFLARLAPNGAILGEIPLRSIEYDPTQNIVIITPNPPLLGINVDYLLQVSRRVAGPGPDDGFMNPDGEHLPCGDFERILRRGTHLQFRDVDGDQVTIGVSQGGLLELSRTPDGQARTVAIRSIFPPPQHLRTPQGLIRGSVIRRGQGDGQVTIDRLIGTSQVRNRLTQPGFRILREVADAPGRPVAQPGPLNQPVLRELSDAARRPVVQPGSLYQPILRDRLAFFFSRRGVRA